MAAVADGYHHFCVVLNEAGAFDLVAGKGDPARTIAEAENVEIVFKDGYAYDPAKRLDSAKGMVGIRKAHTAGQLTGNP